MDLAYHVEQIRVPPDTFAGVVSTTLATTLRTDDRRCLLHRHPEVHLRLLIVHHDGCDLSPFWKMEALGEERLQVSEHTSVRICGFITILSVKCGYNTNLRRSQKKSNQLELDS